MPADKDRLSLPVALPASAMSTLELISLFGEIAGRNAIWDTREMHDRFWEIRRELESRVVIEDALKSTPLPETGSMLTEQLRGIAKHLRAVPEYRNLLGDADIIERAAKSLDVLTAPRSAIGETVTLPREVLTDLIAYGWINRVTGVFYGPGRSHEERLREAEGYARAAPLSTTQPPTTAHVKRLLEAASQVYINPEPTALEWEELRLAAEDVQLDLDGVPLYALSATGRGTDGA